MLLAPIRRDHPLILDGSGFQVIRGDTTGCPATGPNPKGFIGDGPRVGLPMSVGGKRLTTKD